MMMMMMMMMMRKEFFSDTDYVLAIQYIFGKVCLFKSSSQSSDPHHVGKSRDNRWWHCVLRCTTAYSSYSPPHLHFYSLSSVSTYPDSILEHHAVHPYREYHYISIVFVVAK